MFFKRYFSKRPHVPGTPRSKELADEIAKIWQEYNFDKVEMPKYNVLLPYVDPKISNKVQILDTGNNTVFEFSGKEKVIVSVLHNVVPRIFLVMVFFGEEKIPW